jgi:hypothetical protein
MWGDVSDESLGLYLLLGFASAFFLGSESRGDSCPYFAVSNFRLPKLGDLGSCIFYRNKVAQLYLQAF